MKSRRDFLLQAAAAAGAATLPLRAADAPAPPGFRIGSCVTNLRQSRDAGLQGVELGVGGPAERLSIADPAVRARHKDEMRETGLEVCSLMMGLLNSHPLATDPRAPAWLDQSIDAARDLGAKVILVAFFGNGDLLDGSGQVKEAELDAVVQRLKQAAPRAKDAGVTLAIENYLDGTRNARIFERIGHESVGVYYDVFNTGTTKGHDVPADIARLGDRIVQFHFKNGPKFLDDEAAKFEPIAAAVKKSGFRGWIVLETSSPTGEAVADVRRNAAALRRWLA